MSQKSDELRQKRHALINEMHDLTEKTSFVGEANTRWSELDAQQKGIQSQIEAIESTEALRSEMDKTNHVERTQPGVTPENRADLTPQEQRHAKFLELRGSESYKKSFERWLRTGKKDSTFREADELRTYSGLDAQSGTGENIVPIAFQKEIDIKMKYYGGMRNVCRVINTSAGNELQWPTADDTANTGEWLAEAGTVAQLNPSFSQVTFSSNVADSKQVLVSIQLLQDSAFDVQGLLTDMFAIRLGRITNSGYTNGTGTSQPGGILNGVGSTGITNIEYAAGANSNNSSSSYNEVNSIGTDDLGSLIAGIDPEYRPDAKFMATQATFDFLRKVKDGFGRPIWSDSLAAAVPDKIFGYGYQHNADMSGIGASNNSMLFGDFKHYVIRDVGPITTVVFQELYMASLQKGFVSFLRTDGQLLQPAAFAVLQHRLS
jgi:HK97 family phage major capsid protein